MGKNVPTFSLLSLPHSVPCHPIPSVPISIPFHPRASVPFHAVHVRLAGNRMNRDKGGNKIAKRTKENPFHCPTGLASFAISLCLTVSLCLSLSLTFWIRVCFICQPIFRLLTSFSTATEHSGLLMFKY